MLPQQVFRQRDDVFPAVPQRRQLQIDHVEPVVQVFAEGAVGDRLFEVAMGGGDDPDIHLDGFLAAHPLEFVVLEHLQEFGLEAHIHIADFIEQDGAAVGRFKHADLLLERAREGAALVSEQLAFDEFGRQRGAVQFQKNFAGAGRTGMQFPGQDFLAAAGFALNQYGRLGPADVPDERLNLVMRGLAPKKILLRVAARGPLRPRTGEFMPARSMALPSAGLSSSWPIGLQRKSVAPLFIAVTTLRVDAAPDMMSTGISGAEWRISRSTSMPSRCGSIRSSSTAEHSEPAPLSGGATPLPHPGRTRLSIPGISEPFRGTSRTSGRLPNKNGVPVPLQLHSVYCASECD